MQIFKKLLFAPVFLILTASLFFNFKTILDKYLEVFFGVWGGLYELGILALLLILSAFFYCLFITFTQNIKFAVGLIVITAFLPFLFLSPQLAIVITIAFSLSLFVTYFNLQTNLKTYINFQPVNLLSGPVKSLATLMILSLAIGFYFHSNSQIQKNGFKIPDQVLDWAIDLSLKQNNIPVKGEKYLAQAPTQEQIETLRQNPELLKQFGLSTDDLAQLFPGENSNKSVNQNAVRVVPSLPTANIKDIVKTQISNSLDQMVKPYLFAIPMILAFLFYSITSFALWILSIFLSPLILLSFYIFEKTEFVRFDKEMREVKKMAI